MIPYYILLAIVMIIASRYERMPKKTWTPIVLIFITMTLFIGLRDASVGTDTAGYARGFNDFDELDAGERLQWDKEPGFWLLNQLGQSLGDNYAVLLSLVAGVAYTGALFSMKKLSKNLLVSLFVYLTLCYFTFCVNAARQGIAVGIYMLSFQYILSKDLKRYVFWVLVAAMFHKTVVVMLPLYFLFTMKFNIKTISLMVVASVVLTSLLPVFLEYGAGMEQRYKLYLEESKRGGEMLTVFYVAMGVYFIIRRKFIEIADKATYDTFLLMFLSGSIIYALVVSMDLYIELTRFAAYLQVAAVFLWPMILKNEQQKISLTYKTLIILGHLGFMAIYLARMANLVPYSLNSTLFNY